LGFFNGLSVIMFVEREKYMKNIFLALIFILVILPQASFGANSQLTPADQAAVAMYEQEAAQRAAYIKLHHDEIAQQDLVNIAMYKQQALERAAYIKLHHDEIAQQDLVNIAMYKQQALDRAKAIQNSLNP